MDFVTSKLTFLPSFLKRSMQITLFLNFIAVRTVSFNYSCLLFFQDAALACGNRLQNRKNQAFILAAQFISHFGSSETQDVYFTRCPDLSRGKRQNFKKHFYMQNIFKATCNFLGKDAACCYSFLNRPPKAPFLWPHHSYM